MTTVVWFRDDLRLGDHPALHAATEGDDDIVALFVLDEESAGVRPLGGAAKWWLHHSLAALADALAAVGIPLVLRRGSASEIVPEVVSEVGAVRASWNRRYGGAERAIDADLKERLRDAGVDAHSFPGNVLHEPWTIATQQGSPYRVFTPFWRACLAAEAPAEPLPAPDPGRVTRPDPAKTAESDDLAEWGLLPTTPDWSAGLAARWTPGEAEAHTVLEDFLEGSPAEYTRLRDTPSVSGTSSLSPYLRWGEISPREVWHRATEVPGDRSAFLSEVGWRDFAWYTLYHRPEMPTENLDHRFDAFPWAEPDAETLHAWRFGSTGMGIIDAGMQELWQTGTMHNRVRMVCASYLTKNLLLDWRIGEAWFWDTLVDADLASNTFNWQWVAGCGADAAPFFRIFNPETQQKKFDPEGAYVTRWAPESAMLAPLIDLKLSRKRALAAFGEISGGS